MNPFTAENWPSFYPKSSPITHSSGKDKCDKVSRYIEIKNEKPSPSRPYKVKILIGVALTLSALTFLIFYKYRNECWTRDPSDEYNHYTCFKGKWNPTTYIPQPKI